MKKWTLFTLLWLIAAGSSYTFAATLNVWELDLDFCNGSNKLHIDMDAETTTWICMNLKNLSSKDGFVSLGFVDWEMSQGDEPVQACKTSAEGIFGKSVSLTGATTFPIKWWEVLQKIWSISIPKWVAWDLYGCIAFMVVEKEPGTWDDWQMFTIVSRKANTISITVSWDVISNIWIEEWMKLTRNGDGVYTITVKLKNNWTANEQTIGLIHIDDNLLFSKDIQFGNNTQLYPWEEKEFKVELGTLPRFGWKYEISTIIKHTPVDIAGSVVWQEGTVTATLTHEFGILKYWVLPVLWALFGLLAIIFFIERPFVKRRKARKAAIKAAKREAKRQEKEDKKKHD